MNVSFIERQLKVDEKVYHLPCSIMQVGIRGDNLIVLLDPDVPFMGEVSSNLICLNFDGHIVWQASYPTNNMADRYYRIASAEPLVVLSNQSFDCTLNPKDGTVVSKLFTK